MRLAFVTETWVPSIDGVVTRLAATLDHLGRMGHETLVVAPADRRGPRPAPVPGGTVAFPAVGIPFIAGGKPWGLPLRGRMADALDRFEPDLVHVLNPFVLGVAGVGVARSRGLPLVASFHQDIAAVAEHYHLGALGSLIWAHVRRLHAGAALNLATSEAMAAELHAHGIANLGLWRYGVDTERFRPRRRAPGEGAGPVTALYVGRLAVEKDLERLAPLARTPDVRLVVVGDGPLRHRLERSLTGPGVSFRGWLAGQELADAYGDADVFVFPSTTETLGMVLLEALASGLPVVAAASPPTAEILGHGECGVLLDDAGWADLPRVVQGVGRRGPAWEHRSRAARTRIRAWDWSAATEDLVGQYDRVLSGPATPAALPRRAGRGPRSAT